VKTLLIDGANVVRRYAHAMLGDGWDKPSDEDYLRVMESVDYAMKRCAADAFCDHAVIAIDSDGETWRKALYPPYKANREKGEFSWVSALARDAKRNGWCCAEAFRFEADDVIATLVTQIEGEKAVLSSDSDLLCLADRAEVFQFGRGDEPKYVHRKPEWVLEKYGLRRISQLGLYKALVGEPGDNLPGVKGIGPKRAQTLLATYDDADDLFASGKLSEEKCDELDLMLELVTLRTDVPLRKLSN
jgi:DNA polymerase-1